MYKLGRMLDNGNMSVENVGPQVVIPPCRVLLEEMAKHMVEAEFWQSEAAYHEGRKNKALKEGRDVTCPETEAAMFSNKAKLYQAQAQQLGNIILDGNYPSQDLREAV